MPLEELPVALRITVVLADVCIGLGGLLIPVDPLELCPADPAGASPGRRLMAVAGAVRRVGRQSADRSHRHELLVVADTEQTAKGVVVPRHLQVVQVDGGVPERVSLLVSTVTVALDETPDVLTHVVMMPG